MYYSRGHFLESWMLSVTIEAVLWHSVDLALPSPSICLLYGRGDRVMGIRDRYQWQAASGGSGFRFPQAVVCQL